jgi:hypothetical protein
MGSVISQHDITQTFNKTLEIIDISKWKRKKLSNLKTEYSIVLVITVEPAAKQGNPLEFIVL